MNARRLGVLLVAVLALVAAGCGGGGSEEASDTTTVAAGSTTEETSTTEEMTTTEESTEPDDMDTSALSGKCAELAGLGQKLASAMGGQDADVEDVSKLFDEMADRVPDEIKADWQVLAKNFAKIADALKGVDLSSGQPSAEALAKLQQLSSQLDTKELRQATSHIEAWATKNC